VIPEASRVESARAAPSRRPSGRRMFHPRAPDRDEPVQLLERVDRALGGDEAVDDVHEERGSRNGPALEDRGLLVLVHGPYRHSLALERPNPGRDRAAQAAVGAEEGDELFAAAREAVEPRGHVAAGGGPPGAREGDAR